MEQRYGKENLDPRHEVGLIEPLIIPRVAFVVGLLGFQPRRLTLFRVLHN